MGKKLMESVDGQAASFYLGTPDMIKKSSEIEEEFRKGLKKVSNAFGNSLSVKSYKDGNKLFFWYSLGWSKKTK